MAVELAERREKHAALVLDLSSVNPNKQRETKRRDEILAEWKRFGLLSARSAYDAGQIVRRCKP